MNGCSAIEGHDAITPDAANEEVVNQTKGTAANSIATPTQSQIEVRQQVWIRLTAELGLIQAGTYLSAVLTALPYSFRRRADVWEPPAT